MSTAEDTLSKSLLAQLRITTTTPIFVHPIKWSKVHLAILCVHGLDKNYPVEQVIRRDHSLGSSGSIKDKVVVNILREVSMGDLFLKQYMKTLQQVRENGKLEVCLEKSLLSLSGVWLKKIYQAKGYSNNLCRWRLR